MDEDAVAHSNNDGGRAGPSRTLTVEMPGNQLDWMEERVQSGKALSQAEVVSAALDMYMTAVQGTASGNSCCDNNPVEAADSGWTELPRQIEEIIFGKVMNARDIAMPQVRLVCRDWASAAATACTKHAFRNTTMPPTGWGKTFRGLRELDWDLNLRGRELRSEHIRPLHAEELQHLSLLQDLRISGIGVRSIASGTAVAIQAMPSSLTSLALDMPEMTTPEDLAALRPLEAHLKTLDLSIAGHLDSACLQQIAHLTALTSLKLGFSNEGFREDMSHLGRLTSLTDLDLSGWIAIRDADLMFLRSCPHMASLNLRDCHGISDLTFLNGMTGLAALDLTNCAAISNASVAALRVHTNLEDLKLCGGDLIDDQGIAALLHPGMTRLTSLNLVVLENITDEGARSLAHLRGLKSLNLRACQSLTDAGLGALENLTALTSLNISFNHFSDKGMPSLRNLSALTELDLAVCREVSHLGLAALHGLAALTALDLTACLSLDDEALAVISHSFTQLQSLKLENCSITDYGIQQLRALTDLKRLNLPTANLEAVPGMYFDGEYYMDDEYPITRAGVARLQEHLKGCTIEGVTPF